MEAPLCPTCKHHHHSHEKCSVCGHVGKSKKYRKYEAQCKSHSMPYAHVSLRAFCFRQRGERQGGRTTFACEHVYCTERRTDPTPAVGDWRMALLLRKLIFGEHSRPDQLSARDKSAVHCLLFVGDVPVSYSRWVLEEARPSMSSPLSSASRQSNFKSQAHLVIELLGTLAQYRRRGLATKMFHCMLNVGLQQCMLAFNCQARGCKMLCPPFLEKLCQKMNFRWATIQEAGPQMAAVRTSQIVVFHWLFI